MFMLILNNWIHPRVKTVDFATELERDRLPANEVQMEGTAKACPILGIHLYILTLGQDL